VENGGITKQKRIFFANNHHLTHLIWQPKRPMPAVGVLYITIYYNPLV
jgi:hypothetical protein